MSMDQFSLFENSSTKRIIDDGGVVEYTPRFFSSTESENFFRTLMTELAWRQDEITLYGKTHLVPRLQAWYGAPTTNYAYSGIALRPLPMTATLETIKKSVQAATGEEFNCVLANLYRTGSDYAAYHSDDERELGRNPTIASVSFGASRKFRLKHKFDKGMATTDIDLEDGSLLLMKGATQHNYKHMLVKTAKPVHERINLTFRYISP